MQQFIKNITTNLLTKLPEAQLYYTPDDFREAGYPEFLVVRIRLELEKNLADSVSLPDSEWADMQAGDVQDAWDRFLGAIRAETRVPAGHLRAVIETCVEDLLDLLAEPHRYLVETIFRGKSEVMYDEFHHRRKWIVEYAVLADAIQRYMARKQLESITVEKAREIMLAVDQKLTDGFTPLKWGQLLEPVFRLMDNQVPAELFYKYFTDRGLPGLARTFQESKTVVDRGTFVDMLTTTGIRFDFDESTSEFIEEPAHSFSEVTVESDSESIDQQINQEYSIESELNNEPENLEANSADVVGSIGLFHEPEDDNEVNTPDMGESIDKSLDEADDMTEGSTPDLQDSLDFGLDEHPESGDKLDMSGISSEEEPEDGFDINLESLSDTITDTESEESSAPMWERYLETDTGTDIESESPTDDATEDEFTGDEVVSPQDVIPEFSMADLGDDTAEPNEIPELTDPDTDSNTVPQDDDVDVIYLSDRAKDLLSRLEDQRDMFIDEIFRGDERAFYNHLSEITMFETWRQAGRYITRDIFDKNRVDLYSDHAVLFTDAVQEFFESNNN